MKAEDTPFDHHKLVSSHLHAPQNQERRGTCFYILETTRIWWSSLHFFVGSGLKIKFITR